jgi:hypothetical protein
MKSSTSYLKGVPLREERRPEGRAQLHNSYLKLNIPAQEAVQMLQSRDEKAVGGVCLPLAVETRIGERQLCEGIYC